MAEYHIFPLDLVPFRGYKIVADPVFITLLILHVGSIVGWMGGAVLFVSVITPSIRKLSMPARAELMLNLIPRYTRFVAITAIIAILSGLTLYGYITQVERSFAPSVQGLPYIQGGAILGLVVLIIAFGVTIPSSRKLVALLRESGSSDTRGAQVGKLQTRLGMAARLGGALLGVALILMIIGATL